MDNISKYNVAEKQNLKVFIQNEKIIKMGEIGDSLYIIKEGIVSIRIGIKEIRQLKQYDYFGQNAILINTKRMMDVKEKKSLKIFYENKKIIQMGEIG